MEESKRPSIEELQNKFKEMSLIKYGAEFKQVGSTLVDPMCFLDIEMTDPDPRKARIAEIAVYLLSGDLRQ